MEFLTWFSFVLTSSAMLIIPGPTILTVMSYSITHGNKARVPLVLAVGLGDATAVAFSMLGLGFLMSQFTYLFLIVKWVGGIYLLYLGFQLLRSSVNTKVETETLPSVSPKALFINTYLVTALNPKGIIFFIAFLPQFINHEQDNTLQLWILAATFVSLAVFNSMLYAIFAEKLKVILASNRNQKCFNLAGGSCLSLAGIWTLLARQV